MFAVSIATAGTLLYARPAASLSFDSTHIETIFIVAGVVTIAIDSHVSGFACSISPLGDVFNNGGNFEFIKARAFPDISSLFPLSGSLKTIRSIGNVPVSDLNDFSSPLDLGGSLDVLSGETVVVPSLLLGSGPSTDVPTSVSGSYILRDSSEGNLEATHWTHGMPSIGNSIGTTSDEGNSRPVAVNSEGGSFGSGKPIFLRYHDPFLIILPAIGRPPGPFPPPSQRANNKADVKADHETRMFPFCNVS